MSMGMKVAAARDGATFVPIAGRGHSDLHEASDIKLADLMTVAARVEAL